MDKLLRPASLLLYLLSVINFFFGGMLLAGISGAVKGQGLAAGAIVLSYGLYAAFLAFVAALLVSWFAEDKNIIRINRVMLLLLLVIIVIIAIRIFLLSR